MSTTSLMLLLMFSPAFVWQTQSKDDSGPLKPYTTCSPADDLKLRNSTHFKYPGNHREVSIGKERVRVSVVDAYRLVYGYADVPHDLINVKVEQSDANSYAQDKEHVVRVLKHLSSTKQGTKIEYTDKNALHGFEHYAIDRDVIDVGEVVGTHVLFDDAKYLIITVYFLNHEKKSQKRRFHNIEEYRLFKNSVLNRYAECLRKVT